MENLTTEEIIVLDKIIEKLDGTNLDGNTILEICGDKKVYQLILFKEIHKNNGYDRVW